MVKSAYLYSLCLDILALYCLCHILDSQKITRIVLTDETFIPQNLPFCASDQMLGWLELRKCGGDGK